MNYQRERITKRRVDKPAMVPQDHSLAALAKKQSGPGSRLDGSHVRAAFTAEEKAT